MRRTAEELQQFRDQRELIGHGLNPSGIVVIMNDEGIVLIDTHLGFDHMYGVTVGDGIPLLINRILVPAGQRLIPLADLTIQQLQGVKDFASSILEFEFSYNDPMFTKETTDAMNELLIMNNYVSSQPYRSRAWYQAEEVYDRQRLQLRAPRTDEALLSSGLVSRVNESRHFVRNWLHQARYMFQVRDMVDDYLAIPGRDGLYQQGGMQMRGSQKLHRV